MFVYTGHSIRFWNYYYYGQHITLQTHDKMTSWIYASTSKHTFRSNTLLLLYIPWKEDDSFLKLTEKEFDTVMFPRFFFKKSNKCWSALVCGKYVIW